MAKRTTKKKGKTGAKRPKRRATKRVAETPSPQPPEQAIVQ